MDKTRWEQIENLYHAALDRPPAERPEFLRGECAGDAELFREVESLLSSSDSTDHFMATPEFEVGLKILAKPDHVLRSGQDFGHYKVLDFVGRGGMGEVYLAEDTRLGRKVALKVLPADVASDQERIRRFIQEARAASALNHPNILTIHEIGETDGWRFIASEFVDGKTLRERLIGDEPLSLQGVIDIAVQIATALSAAHKVGIVHRDIKPENVMLREDGLVKVLDFGLAKLITAPGGDKAPTGFASTTPGMVMGTIAYMSPEQTRGKKTDARSDIWSLGVVLYEMLAGRLPFAGDTSSDIIAAILTSEPALSGHEPKWLPDGTKHIIAKALRKDPAARYQSAKEMADELRSVPTDESTVPTARIRPATDFDLIGRTDPAFNSTAEALLAAGAESVPGKSHRTKTGLAIGSVFALVLAGGGLLVLLAAFLSYNYFGPNSASVEESNVMPKIEDFTRGGRIMDSAISGDGRLIAHVPIESGKQSLWIRELEGGGEQQLLPPDSTKYWGMRFTPDGQSILYIALRPDSPVTVLYKIAVNGGESRKLIVNIAGPPAISPDGMEIGFVRRYSSKKLDALIVANIDGSGEREIAFRRHPDTFSVSSASWSPDGKLIVVGANRSNNTESSVTAVSVSDGTLLELTSWQWAAVGGTAWDNDGRALIFSARPLGTRVLQLWKLSFPDGELQPITDGRNAYEEVTLASNANILVSNHTFEVSDVWLADVSGTPRRLTTTGKEGADGLTVSPDGRIIYTNGEYEQSNLWSMNPDGGERKRLTENTGFLPSASLDGRYIAYVSIENGVRHVRLMDADGQNDRRLTGDSGGNHPSITPDGNWVVYAVTSDGRPSLWKIPSAGGSAVEMSGEGSFVKPVISPDGASIACAFRQDESDKWKIALLPITGGPAIKTFPLPNSRLQMIRWTPDSLALLYLDARGGGHNVWQQPLDASAPKQLTNFAEDQILHHDRPKTGIGHILARGGRRRNIAIMRGYK